MIQTAKNARRQWADEDDRQLREMAGAGKSITMMALRLKRTVSAVRWRAWGDGFMFLRRPDEQPQECFPDAERSRGHGAVCGSGTEQCRRRAPVQHHTEDSRQMGRTVPRRRCRWFARPLLQTSFIAKPNSACHMRGGGGVAPPAPHRQANRG